MKINFRYSTFVLTLTALLFNPVASAKTTWRQLDLNNTVLMTLPHGKVVVELAPQFAPIHVAQFKKLVKQGFYNGNKFYRVIDGFVAQAGPEGRRDNAPNLAIESEWQPDENWPFMAVQKHDLFAEQTGFSNGFPVGYSKTENKAWLNHCPGMLAMARGEGANSGSSHFYFTIGQAPRYLDRIMTVFGRVVYGMNTVQAIKRTAVIAGDNAVYAKDFTPIVNMQIMSDVPAKQQLIIEVERTNNKAFKEKLTRRMARKSAFFYKKPPKVLDVCQVPILSRLVSAK
jgi:cyclophilin family peptidyl-prolyl cis-trans isomerase